MYTYIFFCILYTLDVSKTYSGIELYDDYKII